MTKIVYLNHLPLRYILIVKSKTDLWKRGQKVFCFWTY